MSLILSGTDGLSDVDGSAATPAIRGTDANTGIFFPAADTIGFAEGGAECARFDSSGNFGVGTASPAAKINIGAGGAIRFNRSDNATYGEIFYGGSTVGMKYVDYNNDGHRFFNTSTQVVTIDTSGNLLVGDTSAAGRVLAKSATSDGTTSSYVGKNSSGTILLDIISTGYFKTGVAANSPYNNATGSGANVFVGSDGALFRSTSSLKYKTDVQDATFGIADVLKLRAVTYKGKGSSDGDKVFAGLIAEEVHDSGLTQFVQYADDGSPDALSYGNMVSLCIKAIQEQQALITQLQADVAALKGA